MEKEQFNNAIVCIDDSNRPEEIPLSHWVKKDMVYHVLKVSHTNFPVFVVFFELEEIDLTPFPPYKGFDTRRFRQFAGATEVEELINELQLNTEEK